MPEGRLPCSRWADDAWELARRDGEVDGVERQHAALARADIFLCGPAIFGSAAPRRTPFVQHSPEKPRHPITQK
jgi:hypothetical protein